MKNIFDVMRGGGINPAFIASLNALQAWQQQVTDDEVNIYHLRALPENQDSTNHILDFLESDATQATPAVSRRGYVFVHPAAPGAKVRLDKPTAIYHDNITVDFTPAPLLLGEEGGRSRTSGGLAQTSRRPSGSACALRAASTTNLYGKMVLPLVAGHGAALLVGDRIVVRGQNDKTGRTIEKQVTFIESIDGDDVTCTDEPLLTFYPTYPLSEWAADLTTGTTIYLITYSQIVGDVNIGTSSLANSVEVLDSSLFSVGEVVLISDSSREYDLNEYMTPGYDYERLYYNAAQMEMKRVVSIVGNVLYFDRPIQRFYRESMRAGVSKLECVTNSHIVIGDVFFAGTQTSVFKCFELTYSDRCSITGRGTIHGQDVRAGDAIRFSYAYDCDVYDGFIDGCYVGGGGIGYGLSVYYSSSCRVHRTKARGCRHNFLVAASTDIDFYDIETIDDIVSGFDVHGSNSYGIRVNGITVSHADDQGTAGTRRALAGVTTSAGIRVGNNSHSLGDRRIHIQNVHVNGYVGGSALDISPACNDVVVENVYVRDADYPFRLGNIAGTITPVQTMKNITLKNWTVIRCGEPYIRPTTTGVSSKGKIDGLRILGYTEEDCSGHLNIIAGVQGDLNNLVIDDYKILSSDNVPGVAGIDITNVTNVAISNSDTRKANVGFKVTGCDQVDAQGNRFDNPVDGATYDVVDGGGNTNLLVCGNSGGYHLNTKQIMGALVAGATVTAVVLSVDDLTPTNAQGQQIVSGTYTSKVGRKLRLGACIPYLAVSAIDMVTLHLFVDGVHVNTWSGRLNSGATTGFGIPMLPREFVVTSNTPMTIELRIGAAGGSTITLNNKFNGMAMPFITVDEIL